MADGGGNTARSLAAALGLHCAFHAARTKMRRRQGASILCASGLAILSRSPIVWSERLVLPSDPRDGERIAQFAEIDVERTRVHLINLHLSHLEFADNLRRQQLDTILERLNGTKTEEHIVLGGDFNAKAGDAVFEAFSARTDFVTRRAPSDGEIGLGVDHLFTMHRAGAAPLLISSARAELARPDKDGVVASDHAAVRAWISFETSNIFHVAAISQ